MINELLWLAGAKQQHDIQKASGLAGIVGILTVLFIAFKWQDWFYPLFKYIGAVDLAHRLGLVKDDYPAMTVIYIVLFLCTCILFVGILAIALLFGSMLLMLFGKTEIGKLILGAVFMLVLLPFMLPHFIKAYREHKQTLADEKDQGYIRPLPFHKALNKDKNLKELASKYNDEIEHVKMFRIFEEQTIQEGYAFEKLHDQQDWQEDGLNKASNFLNRAVTSIENDHDWLIGYRRDERKAGENKFFVFFPNPLPRFASKYFLDDCYEEGSLVRSNEYVSKGQHLYDFLISSYEYGEEPNKRERRLLHVPSIEIEFVWDGYAVSPKVVEGAEVKSMTMDYSSVYRVQAPRLKHFFNELSKEEKVQHAIKEAHIALYLIPLAYPNDKDKSDWGYTGDFNKFFTEIPNADTYAPLYAADVQERIIAYANNQKEWAINWIAQDA